jgi:hypothetical protein
MIIGTQNRDISGTHDFGGHDAVAIFALQSSEQDDVILPDVPQGPEQRIAVAGDAYVPGLSRQRRPANVPAGAAQSGFVGTFGDYHSHAEARDFHSPQQSIHGIRAGTWGRRRLQLTVESTARLTLKVPGIGKRESTITQQAGSGGEESGLRPVQNSP